MQSKTQKLLNDIRDAASFILTSASGHDLQSYLKDRLLRQAVERNFEIIGEAMNRLRKIDPTTTSLITDADRIIAFRNVLIHVYHLIDDAEVWRIISTSLPILLREVEAILAGGGGPTRP